MTNSPMVSVVMTVYNGEKYLSEAIESILGQTFKDFEFIIVDDGSVDRSLEIINSYKDKRIKAISHKNQGVSASCNKAIRIARGKYIARQDADDISEPTRFEKQVRFLNKNTGVCLLGTNYHVIDGSSKITMTTNVFTKPADVKLAEVFSNQFGHGSVMIRRTVFKRTGLYNPKYKIAQDVDLWVRISHVAEIANLKEPLYIWRSVGEGLSTSSKNAERIKEEVYEIRNRAFKHYLEHKSDYGLSPFRPNSIRGSFKSYMEMKNRLFRDMSLMYSYRGYRRYAILPNCLAILFAPWKAAPYKQLFVILFNKSGIKKITYEAINRSVPEKN